LIDRLLILVLLIQARFALSSKSRWAEKGGIFCYHTYYYDLMKLIDECEDITWKDSLFKHYNMYVLVSITSSPLIGCCKASF
jgi:hypothetical protein